MLINLDRICEVLDLANEVMLLIDDDLVLRMAPEGRCLLLAPLTLMLLDITKLSWSSSISWEVAKSLRCNTYACLASPPFVTWLVLLDYRSPVLCTVALERRPTCDAECTSCSLS